LINVLGSPNFLIVGFQKCGSSSLQALLEQHSAIKATNPKETFALSDRTSSNFNQEHSILNESFSWSQFVTDPEKEAKYFLEASVNNFYQEEALSYAKKNPDVKVLFILRDPIQRFVSSFNYYGANGIHLDSRISINEFYSLVKEGKVEHEALAMSLEHGRYMQYINKWKQALGNERIHLISFKKVLNDPSTELKGVWQFLDLEPLPKELLVFPEKNRTKRFKYPMLNRFLRQYFRGFAPKRFKKVYRKAMKVAAPKTELSIELKEKLKSYYHEEYRELSEYF